MSEITLKNDAPEKRAPATASLAAGERSSFRRRAVALSAAILLLTAAALKAWPLLTGSAVESQATSIGKLVLIQGEILLAFWLTSGVGAAWAFRVAILFFAGAAIVNLRSIWLGEGSCGCFGKVEVPPWVSLILNSGLLAGLIWKRPKMTGGFIRSTNAAIRSCGWAPLVCVLMVIVGGGLAVARSYFRPVVIEAPKAIDLGELIAGEKKRVSIPLRNLSDKPVVTLGARTSCKCSVVEGLPVTIAPNSSSDVMLQISISQNTGYNGSIMFYTDNSHSPTFEVRYFGKTPSAYKQQTASEN